MIQQANNVRNNFFLRQGTMKGETKRLLEVEQNGDDQGSKNQRGEWEERRMGTRNNQNKAL